MRNSLKWTVGLSLGAVGLVALGGVVLREPLAEQAAEAYLHARGFPQAAVSIARIGWDRTVIDSLTLGPSLPSIARVELFYRPVEILRMRLREVRIDGLRASFDGWGQEELSRLGALLPPNGRETGEKGFSPGPKVDVTDFRVEFRDPDRGDMTVTGQGRVDLSEPRVGASIDAVAQGGFGDASLTVVSEDITGKTAVLDVQGRADVDLVRLPWPDGLEPRPRGGRVAVSLTGALPMPVFETGAMQRTLEGEGQLSADISLRQIELPPYADSVDGKIRLDLGTGGGRLRVRIEEPSSLTVKGLSASLYREVEQAGIALSNSPGDAKRSPVVGSLTVSASLTGGGGQMSLRGEGSWTGERGAWLPLDLAAKLHVRGARVAGADIRSADWQGAVAVGPEGVRLEGPFEGTVAVEEIGETAASGRLLFAAPPAGLTAGRVEIADGSLRMPARDFRAERIDATLPVALENGSEPIRISAVASTISDLIAPLDVEARVTVEKTAFVVDGALAVPGQGLRVPVKATYPREGTRGRVTVGPVRVEFDPGGLQPRDLGSVFSLVTRADGIANLEATIAFVSGQARGGNAVLEFEDLSLASEEGIVDRLNGSVRLDRLFPPSTAGPQTVTARRIVAGVPLEEPVVRFHTETGPEGPVVVVDRGEGRFAAGEVSIDGARWRLFADSNAVDIKIRGLSLERLLRDYAMEGVSGTGTLSGHIPLKVSAGGVTIDSGVLQAEDGGVLRVSWGGAGDALLRQGEYVALMVQALQDFRFKVLRAQVDRPEEGELAAKVTLEGHNPSVRDGYPIRFNIALSGELEEILAAVREGDRLSSDLFSGALGGSP